MKILEAKYLKDYKIEVSFSNNEVKIVDLKNFIFTSKSPLIAQYKDKKLFKQVMVDNGDLTWGDNGEMDFHCNSVYDWEKELQEQKTETLSISQYAKELNKPRQTIIYRVNHNLLPSNITANLVGNYWALTRYL